MCLRVHVCHFGSFLFVFIVWNELFQSRLPYVFASNYSSYLELRHLSRESQMQCDILAMRTHIGMHISEMTDIERQREGRRWREIVRENIRTSESEPEKRAGKEKQNRREIGRKKRRNRKKQNEERKRDENKKKREVRRDI